MTSPAIATPVPTVPPMIGNPNRTMVAMADTDPGRSVGPATAAAVAAMTAPGGYGKLVVLSSNFAGKEFELSRPQMIIGRTDENDIVINHRSISRNHAKLVREPETSRYTISDLQSSNGVRVNGSDYGKVELRRGDVDRPRPRPAALRRGRRGLRVRARRGDHRRPRGRQPARHAGRADRRDHRAGRRGRGLHVSPERQRYAPARLGAAGQPGRDRVRGARRRRRPGRRRTVGRDRAAPRGRRGRPRAPRWRAGRRTPRPRPRRAPSSR